MVQEFRIERARDGRWRAFTEIDLGPCENGLRVLKVTLDKRGPGWLQIVAIVSVRQGVWERHAVFKDFHYRVNMIQLPSDRTPVTEALLRRTWPEQVAPLLDHITQRARAHYMEGASG